MRVFLDENVPLQIAQALPEFELSSVHQEGWRGIANGALLDRIETRFSVLVTTDGHMLDQNRFAGRRLSVVVIPTNSLKRIMANIGALRTTLVEIGSLDHSVAIRISWTGDRTMRRLDAAMGSEQALLPVAPFPHPKA